MPYVVFVLYVKDNSYTLIPQFKWYFSFLNLILKIHSEYIDLCRENILLSLRKSTRLTINRKRKLFNAFQVM